MKRINCRTRENTAFRELMKRIGIAPKSELPKIEQRALQVAKDAVNWAGHQRRVREREAAE
jgi:hypothetical protein